MFGHLKRFQSTKVSKFHRNLYNFVACLPNPYKLSILHDIWRAPILQFSGLLQILLWNLVDLLFEYLSFSNKRKTAILFPSPLTLLQRPLHVRHQAYALITGIQCIYHTVVTGTMQGLRSTPEKGRRCRYEAEHKMTRRKAPSDCAKREKNITLSEVTIAKVLPLDKVSDNFLLSFW